MLIDQQAIVEKFKQEAWEIVDTIKQTQNLPAQASFRGGPNGDSNVQMRRDIRRCKTSEEFLLYHIGKLEDDNAKLEKKLASAKTKTRNVRSLPSKHETISDTLTYETRKN